MNKKIFFSVYLLVIILLVLLPINDKNSKINHTYFLTIRLDHIIHALLFSPWMFFYDFIKPFQFAKRINKISWFFAGLFFCSMAELLQYFTPYRALTMKDLVANCIGVIVGSILFMLLDLKHTRRERTHH